MDQMHYATRKPNPIPVWVLYTNVCTTFNSSSYRRQQSRRIGPQRTAWWRAWSSLRMKRSRRKKDYYRNEGTTVGKTWKQWSRPWLETTGCCLCRYLRIFEIVEVCWNGVKIKATTRFQCKFITALTDGYTLLNTLVYHGGKEVDIVGRGRWPVL